MKANTVQNSCQKCVLSPLWMTMSVAWLSQALVQPSHRASWPAMSPGSIFHRNSGERFPAHLVTMAAPEASYLIASGFKIQGDLPNSWEKTSCPCGQHRHPRGSKYEVFLAVFGIVVGSCHQGLAKVCCTAVNGGRRPPKPLGGRRRRPETPKSQRRKCRRRWPPTAEGGWRSPQAVSGIRGQLNAAQGRWRLRKAG